MRKSMQRNSLALAGKYVFVARGVIGGLIGLGFGRSRIAAESDFAAKHGESTCMTWYARVNNDGDLTYLASVPV